MAHLRGRLLLLIVREVMIVVAYNLVGCNNEDVLRLRGKEPIDRLRINVLLQIRIMAIRKRAFLM